MKTNLTIGLLATALIFPCNIISAHDGDENEEHPDVEINVNPDLKTCGFEISPNLTQEDWHIFTKQLGNILYFNPLASAKPLGVKNFDILLEQKQTSINQTSGAWNNTFSHPDSMHYLGDEISLPFIHARMGITDKVDVGIIFSHSAPFGGNYGFLGAEVKYAFLNDLDKGWAASVRTSHLQLISVSDFNISTTGIDVSGSKTFGVFTPYVGLAGTFTHSKETTDAVSLKNENVWDAKAIVGAEIKWKFIMVGSEVNVSELTTYNFKLGVSF